MEEPKIIGRYALFTQIDAGGMAAVYIGRSAGAAGFARTVAIKRLHAQFAQDPAFARMFVDEAWVASRIRHPNVVPVLDVVTIESEIFLVLELVLGQSLSRLVPPGGFLPPSIACSIVHGALQGLHAAHTATDEFGRSLGLVHRDVSPQNILVGKDGVARLIDFGVAKALGRSTASGAGELKGKLAYMAPEQIDGHVSSASDVFAAGIVLWELLVGERLFLRDTGSATLAAVASEDIPPPSTVRAYASPRTMRSIDVILMRALARDPGRRFATALDFATALEHATAVASTLETARWVEEAAGPELASREAAIAEVERSSLRLPRLSDEVLSGRPPAPRPHAAGTTMPPALPFSPARASRARLRSRVAFAGAAVLVAGAAGLLFGAGRVRSRELVQMAAASSGPVAPPAVSRAPSCPEGMLPVAGGAFFMGSDDKSATADERPAHPVELRPYCLDATEVTLAEYRACSDHGHCKRSGTENEWEGITALQHRLYDPLCNARDPEGRGAHPVNCVDWDMASRFCREVRGGRLPTEAEWEFAARGSDGRTYPWGDGLPSADLLNACGGECVAWGRTNYDPGAPLSAMYKADDGFATTAPVGQYPKGKTRYGMQDMAGNVWEWVADFHAPYTYSDNAAVNPKGPSIGEERVIRGGAWNGSDPAWLRPTYRYFAPPVMRSHGIGFRCARTLL